MSGWVIQLPAVVQMKIKERYCFGRDGTAGYWEKLLGMGELVAGKGWV